MEPTNEPQTGKTNIGATVITSLIVIIVLIAIALVCYAQKFKVRLENIFDPFGFWSALKMTSIKIWKNKVIISLWDLF